MSGLFKTISEIPIVGVRKKDGTVKFKPLVDTTKPIAIKPEHDPNLSLTGDTTINERGRANLKPTDDPYHPFELQTGATGRTPFRRKTD